MIHSGSRSWEDSQSERQPGRFDVAGALTSTAGMASLVYGFIPAAQHGWSDTLTIAAFVAAVVLLAVFVSIETRTRLPITPLHCSATGRAATPSCSAWPRGFLGLFSPIRGCLEGLM